MTQSTKEIELQAGKHLGQKSEYSEYYNPDLLVAVERAPNRSDLGLTNDTVPWKYGYDLWNAYELSFLLDNGMPVSGVVKIVYPSNSEYIVESKSLKLYLNSFNQSKFGDINTAYDNVSLVIQQDLINLLEVPVEVGVLRGVELPFHQQYFSGYTVLETLPKCHSVEFNVYTEDSNLLKVIPGDENSVERFKSTNLFSRCAITHQPDHGDLYITYKSKDKIDPVSLMQYIASFRKHSCFHEPTLETIYNSIYNAINPERLMCCALYTRRGGISIAPIRASHKELIPLHLIDVETLHIKSLRE